MFNRFLSSYRLFIYRFFSILLFILTIYLLISDIDYFWQWERVTKYIFSLEDGKLRMGILLKGVLITIKISIVAFVIATMLGVIFAVFRISNYRSLRIFGFVYVETIRNTPLLVQILFSYFIISHIFDLDGFYVAVVTLSLFEGAYIAEIVRGAIVSIERGQWDAGTALGMNRFKLLRYIIFPQALPSIIPPLGNILVTTVKDSSLLSVISIYELTFQAQKIVSETFLTFEIWFLVALIYFLINIIIIRLLRYFEKYLEVSR